MTPSPSSPGQPTKKATNAVLIVVLVLAALGGCCVVGILAAIAIPNFVKYQGRAKTGECKSELRAIYLAEMTYFEEKKTWALDFNALGQVPSQNRYTYFLGPTAVKAPGAGKGPAVPLSDLPALAGGAVVGVEGECPSCTFTAACAANIDSDPDLDVWSISSADRGAVPAGQLEHDKDDLR